MNLKKLGLFLLVGFTMLVLLKYSASSFFAPTTSGYRGLETARPDLLLVGSSRTRQSYDVKSLETITDGDVYLLAYNGFQPAFLLPVMEEIVKAPTLNGKTVVLELYPYAVVAAPKISDPRIFYNARPPLKNRLLSRLKGYEFSYSEIFTLVVSEGNESILTYPFLAPTLDGLSYRGGYVGKIVGGMTASEFSAIKEPVETLDVQAILLQQRALFDIVATCRAAEMKVWLVEPPVPQPIRQARIYSAVRNDIVKAAAAQGVRLLTSDDYSFDFDDPTMFNDPLHLSTAGREIFTRVIAEKLQPEGSGKP